MAQTFKSYDVDADRLFRQALARARKATSDLRIPFGLILADFYVSERAIFQLQSEGQYPDLKEETKDRKEREVGFVYPILKRTGRLAASLLSPNSPDSIAEIVNRDTLIIGTAVEYGVYHQSDDARTKIPLRKFLFIGPEAPTFATREMLGRPGRWLNILNEYVLQVLERENVGKAV